MTRSHKRKYRINFGSLLFLLYINDIVNDIGANIRLFADDTSLSNFVENPIMAAVLILIYLNFHTGQQPGWYCSTLRKHNH